MPHIFYCSAKKKIRSDDSAERSNRGRHQASDEEDSDVKKQVKEMSELSTWEGFIGGWLVLPLLLSGTLSSRHASLGLKFSCVGETQLAVTCLVVKFILYVCDCCWLE